MDNPIQDDEITLRHIPGDKDHLADGQRSTSANFELRDGEEGLSDSRAKITTPDQLMQRTGNLSTGSRIAGASVSEVRKLGLEVVPKPTPEDPGHAEIVPMSATLQSRSLRRKVARLFKLID